MDAEKNIVTHIKVKKEDLNLKAMTNLLLSKFSATRQVMTNFPYDIQMTAMFIFITLYLVMDIIF